MKREKIVINKIKKCVNKLYNKDKYLFDCKVCERCLMFRFAYYLQKEFPNYFVDCEFNKMGFHNYKHEGKVILVGKNLKRMYADIIIHKRNSREKDNFICVEIKRIKRDLDKDFQRLRHMTDINGFRHKNKNYVYSYDFGFSIFLLKDKDRCRIELFRNGKDRGRFLIE